jgi:hypothetical protein
MIRRALRSPVLLGASVGLLLIAVVLLWLAARSDEASGGTEPGSGSGDFRRNTVTAIEGTELRGFVALTRPTGAGETGAAALDSATCSERIDELVERYGPYFSEIDTALSALPVAPDDATRDLATLFGDYRREIFDFWLVCSQGGRPVLGTGTPVTEAEDAICAALYELRFDCQTEHD